ncbi:hypothetical protein K1728_05695 [Weissella confusa]|uniref:hypothetical protein n=1 Tax=Weissella confusa TaxID=1583 RepID=UPI001C6F69FC|nr:hypothetical protein [Weissella confusa]QYU58892.1 hypothetical protein K1728_05695 [Weissella confusa]
MAVVFGRQTETTVYEDLAIANRFGGNAVSETIERLTAFVEEAQNPVYLAELVAALNHNLWHFYQAGNKEYSEIYSRNYESLNELFFEKWNVATGDTKEQFGKAYSEILD